MHRLVLLFVVSLVMPAFSAENADWPQFRGEGARGVSDNPGLPEKWSATENVAWKTEIPGQGWSSPIVWGDKVFLTTAITAGEVEAPKKGLYLGGERKDVPQEAYQWVVYALDLQTGKVVWERKVHEGAPPFGKHVKNTYASETPVTDGERVYAVFGNIGIWCLDFDGNVVWNKPLEPRKMGSAWGTAASPVLHRDRVYFCNDNEESSYLLALDKKTGEEIWRIPREEESNWSTPFIWENGQRAEIVTTGSGGVRSYDLEGKELWSLKGMSSITIATPYVANGLLFVSSGYVGDKSRPIYAIKPGATGDISLAEGQTSNEWIAWSAPQGAPYNPSTIVYNDRLYVVYDMGAFACYNALDGSVVLEKKRMREIGTFTASPWAYNGKVFCLNEDGVTHVFNAGDPVGLLYNNPLAEDDMGMATPAIAGDKLLIRTSKRMYCIKQ